MPYRQDKIDTRTGSRNNSEEEIIDVSNGKDSPYAKQFRTIVRRPDKLLQTPETHTDPKRFPDALPPVPADPVKNTSNAA